MILESSVLWTTRESFTNNAIFQQANDNDLRKVLLHFTFFLIYHWLKRRAPNEGFLFILLQMIIEWAFNVDNEL